MRGRGGGGGGTSRARSEVGAIPRKLEGRWSSYFLGILRFRPERLRIGGGDGAGGNGGNMEGSSGAGRQAVCVPEDSEPACIV